MKTTQKVLTKVVLATMVILIIAESAKCQINAEFISSELSACNSLQTTFFDQSTSEASIIDWSWDLGGNTSATQNPSSLFTEPGSFTICLTVTDVNGNSDTECKENYITIFPNPTPNYSIDKSKGCIPVTVNFSDNTSSANGNIVSWIWDVGGSAGVLTQTSSADFSSTYNIQGSYAASLTVVDEKGCSATISDPNVITASSIVSPDIRVDLEPTCELPWNVNFTNQNSDPLITYDWDFGNGETYVGIQPPAITYNDLGSFDITIYMSSGECTDTVVLLDFIDTNSSASFEYSPSVICQYSPVNFTDISINAADAVLWNFGDGSTSTESNPSHSYSSAGCFDVSLIRTVGGCIDTAIISCITILELPNVSYDITNQFACTVPVEVLLHAESPSTGDISWQFIRNGVATDYNENDVAIEISEFDSYYAVLSFEGESGCQTIIDSILVDIAPLEVNMPVKEITGCAPLTFTLVDSISSNIEITSYQWSIGNPEEYSSQLKNPTFTIADTGRYDLQLIAENIYGCIDTIVIKDYIQVGNLPVVDFTADPIFGCVDSDISFTNLSSDFANSWEWFFGNEGTSLKENPDYPFPDAEIYDVALYTSHNGCTDSLRIKDYITIYEPASKFSVTYNCEDPFSVNISNRTIGADSLIWTIGLSGTESITFTDSMIGDYTFLERGLYPISLFSKNYETGCENIENDTIRIVDPIASYALDSLRGCAPFTLGIENLSQDADIYEFQSDIANIDSIFKDEPTITFTEGGQLEGPLLIITDIHECKDSFQLSDTLQVNKLVANVDFTDVICVPDVADFNDQSTTVLSNIASWDWNVSPGSFTSSAQDTSLYIEEVGNYNLSFKIEDDWGCKDSISIANAITAIKITPDFTFDSLGCSWAPIDFKSSGHDGNIVEYSWDFGDGNTSNLQNPRYTYSSEGTYSVCLTMSAVLGCSKTICKENIITISDPKAQYIGDPIFATCPPLLSNFENQSINAISYNWDFGDNSGQTDAVSPSHVYTSPGRYDVTLIATSTPVCSDTLYIDDYVKVEGPKGDFEADIVPSCLPVSVTLNATSDGFYNYVWDLGNGVLDSVDGLAATDVISYEYNQPGRYTPKLIITDSIGCSRSFAGDPITVDFIDIDFSIESEIICGPPIAVSLQNQSEGTTENVNYEWQITGTDNFDSNEMNPTFNIQTSGQYNVGLIAEYGSCIDTLFVTDFMEIADIPEVIFEIQTEELCEDVNVMFVNNSSVTYGEFVSWFWDFGDGNTSTEMSPTHRYEGLEGKTITLIGITDKGCEQTYSSSFEVLPSTIASVEDDKIICIGDQVQISGTIENLQPTGSFFWEPEASLSCTDCLSPIATPLVTTSYVLVAVHPNGCESRDTIEIIVIPTPGPELSLQSDSLICLGTETMINVVNFNSNYSYQWDQSIQGQDCYINCDTILVSPAESTSYFVTVTNEFGCFKRDSAIIDVETSIEDFLPAENAICFGAETTISISNGNNPQWGSDSEIECQTCAENIVSPEQTTVYTVMVQSDLGCSYEDSISVIVVPTNSADAGELEEICLGETVSLSATGFGSTLWSSNSPLSVNNESVITVSPIQSEYFYLNMTYYECSQMDSVQVIVHEKAEIEVFGDTICTGEIASISANGRADQYEWQMDDEIETTMSIDVTPEFSTEYQVIASYRTCIPDTAIALAYVHPHIDYKVEEDYYNIFLNDQINILPEYGQERNYSYDWFPSTGLSCADCPNPIIKGIEESMNYNILVVDEDTYCKTEHEITVRFNNECSNAIFYLPNIFSPNNDGSNDTWHMSTNNPEEFLSINVFDRYGNFVFSTEDINESWDGKFNGRDLVSGVYVYKVKLICPYNDEEYFIIGDVTIVR